MDVARRTCQTCQTVFASRSKMFRHIKQAHAQTQPHDSARATAAPGVAGSGPDQQSSSSRRAHRDNRRSRRDKHGNHTTTTTANNNNNNNSGVQPKGAIHGNVDVSGVRACRQCGQVFDTHDALLAHLASDHAQPVERRTCRVCASTFPTRTAMFQHINEAHAASSSRGAGATAAAAAAAAHPSHPSSNTRRQRSRRAKKGSRSRRSADDAMEGGDGAADAGDEDAIMYRDTTGTKDVEHGDTHHAPRTKSHHNTARGRRRPRVNPMEVDVDAAERFIFHHLAGDYLVGRQFRDELVRKCVLCVCFVLCCVVLCCVVLCCVVLCCVVLCCVVLWRTGVVQRRVSMHPLPCFLRHCWWRVGAF